MLLTEINIEKRLCHDKTAIIIIEGIFLVLMYQQYMIAGFEKQQQSSRAIGMGNALTAQSIGAWSLFYNPANIAGNTMREGVVFYSPAPFDVKEFAIGAAGFVQPTSFGLFGLSIQTSGFELYREIGVGITYANAYRNFQYGFTVNYFSLSIDRYGSTSTISIDAGSNLSITDNLRIGAVIYNINRPTIGEVKDHLPLIFSIGTAYSPSETIVLCADVQKDIHYSLNARFGFEYTPIEFLQLRIGNTTEPSRFSAGIGVKYDFIRFDYALQTHTELSATHSVSLAVHI